MAALSSRYYPCLVRSLDQLPYHVLKQGPDVEGLRHNEQWTALEISAFHHWTLAHHPCQCGLA
uniref:Uncharacterized protein n=1 Tax=Arundo donax TaxID=35708 RepID=A0A0A9DYW8_ARUDO